MRQFFCYALVLVFYVWPVSCVCYLASFLVFCLSSLCFSDIPCRLFGLACALVWAFCVLALIFRPLSFFFVLVKFCAYLWFIFRLVSMFRSFGTFCFARIYCFVVTSIRVLLGCYSYFCLCFFLRFHFLPTQYFSDFLHFRLLFFIFLPLEVLRKELKSIKDSYDEKSVDSALKYVRLLLSRPPAIFDAFATLAALEQLSDLAREKGHEQASRFAIITRQGHLWVLLHSSKSCSSSSGQKRRWQLRRKFRKQWSSPLEWELHLGLRSLRLVTVRRLVRLPELHVLIVVAGGIFQVPAGTLGISVQTAEERECSLILPSSLYWKFQLQ